MCVFFANYPFLLVRNLISNLHKKNGLVLEGTPNIKTSSDFIKFYSKDLLQKGIAT